MNDVKKMLSDNSKPSTANGAKSKKSRQVTKHFYAFSGGFVLCIGPFAAMITLQSSINIKESVGTLAMGIAYIVSVAVSLFVTPIAVRRLGTKWVLILGEMSYLVYIAGNFYPRRWIMVGAGMIVGAGEAMVWTTLPMYLWHFGYVRGTSGTKNLETYARKYTGIFYALTKLAQILGNSLSYGVLYGGKQSNDTGYIDGIASTNESEEAQKYQYCGAKDCQNLNVTDVEISRFVPENATSLLILIAIFCGLNSAGVIFHYFFLPHATSRHLSNSSSRKSFQEKEEQTEGSGDVYVVSTDGKRQLSYCSTLGATFKHASDKKQLLLAPLLCYHGIEITIILAEASRSFVSCVLGVEQIGLVMISFAFVTGCISAVIPKVIEKIGRNKVIAILLTLDLCNYTFCLVWRPTSETKFLIYMIYFGFAMSEPVWKNCIFDIYTEYFPKDQEISFTIWNIWITIGVAVGFLWSPLFCVYVKLFIQIGLLIASMLFYCVAEYLHNKKSRI